MRAGIPLARQPDVRRIPPDGTVYTFGGKVICEYRTGRREIPPAFRLVWERYLAYDWPIHPDIREAILLNAKVPSEIRFREKIGERTRYRNLTLSSLELVADSAYTAEIRDAPFAPSGIPVERIWNRLRGDGPAPRRLAPADFDQAFKTSVKNSLFSEALLVAIESNLQEGRDIGAAIQALAPGMDMDPILIQLIKGMDIADAAAAAKALDALEDVSANAFARGHIVHVLRADALRRQEKWKEAEAEYLLALEANPYLTAALVRLGNVYVETARIQQAYLAWELAAWIQARHPLLGDIRALDQAVRQEHPLFFLPAER
jgi:hypothetical protein